MRNTVASAVSYASTHLANQSYPVVTHTHTYVRNIHIHVHAGLGCCFIQKDLTKLSRTSTRTHTSLRVTAAGRYMPDRCVLMCLHRPLGFQEVVAAPSISRQSTPESDKVVSPTHRLPLPPRRHPWYSFLLEAESTPGP